MDETFAGQTELHAPSLGFGRIDAAVLLLTSPFLLVPGLFPRAVSGIALFLLLLPYILRLARGERLSRPTAANLPVAILALVYLPLAFLLSPAPWAITWVHVTTLAWSIALFFAVVNWTPPLGRGEGLRTRINGPTRLYLALGAITAVAGLVGMRSVDKLFFVAQTGFLADLLGWKNGLPTNEIAGVLTLFIPFVIALAVGCGITGRKRPFFLLLPLVIVMPATLVLTQSRTGIAASAVGITVALLAGMRISFKWVASLVALLAAAVLAISFTPLFDWFVFAGASSWDSVIGPRLGIWNQALDGIRDLPLWGMGFGVFGPLARFVFPLVAPEAGPVLEDAHNLYLQTALDFGLAGLLVFLVVAAIVIISAVRLVRIRPARSLARLWAAGLLGALVAHALYSLTDAVALGTLAGVPLWFLFGLVMSATRARLRVTWSIPGRILFGSVVALAVLVSLLSFPSNRAGQLAVRALIDPAAATAETSAAIGRLSATSCRSRWYEGLSFHTAGDPAGRTAAWGGLLACSDDYTGYMAALAPTDVELARQAIAARPESSAGYFWLAPLVAAESPAEAADLYRQGLALVPEDGRYWLALADLLRPTDEAAALEAYLQACLNGDPGANGCLRAGTLAEANGDPQAAIEYYRLSKWDGARVKADELEKQLAAGQP